MDFGEALGHLRAGRRLRPSRWEGTGKFVVLQRGYPEGVPINANTAVALDLPEGTTCRFRPYLLKRTIDGSFVPWVPTQGDILGSDWSVVTE
jgi:hypothetical protein